MKKYTSYLACMSVVIAGLAASNNVDAGNWGLFKKYNKHRAENVADDNVRDVNKQYEFSLGHKKIDRSEDVNSVAFNSLNSTASQKVDKGLGKLLESREKIDVEIMKKVGNLNKKVGNLNVNQYKIVDQFIEELTGNALIAIGLANKANDVNGKITCISYISKLYMFAQNKKWNEFKHGLTEFGNITFASSHLNNLKNDVISGIKDLFIKYFSHNGMHATDIVQVKNSPKILAIEDEKANTDTSVMLGGLTDGASVHKQAHRPTRPTSSKWKNPEKPSSKRNGPVTIGNYRKNNLQNQEAIALGSFLDEGSAGEQNAEESFNIEYVDNPQTQYSISDIPVEEERIAQVAVKQNAEEPFNVEYADDPLAMYSISDISGEKEQIPQMHNDVGVGRNVKTYSMPKGQSAVNIQVGPNGEQDNSQETKMSVADKRKFFEEKNIYPRMGSTQK